MLLDQKKRNDKVIHNFWKNNDQKYICEGLEKIKKKTDKTMTKKIKEQEQKWEKMWWKNKWEGREDSQRVEG